MKNPPQLRARRGFSLVITMSLMVLLLLLAVGLLSLSSITLRAAGAEKDMAVARANARMALILAIGELQKNMGPDQRVSANASILETNGASIANPNWVGAWKTTLTAGSNEWPMIGKKSDRGSNDEPYPVAFAYRDLRNTMPTWKDDQRLEWLVSNPNPTQKLDASKTIPRNEDSVEMVGTGSLGSTTSQGENVLAYRVPLEKRAGQPGGYAWWVSDNNQKASLNLAARGATNTNLAAAQKDDPGGVDDGFRQFYKNNNEAFYQTLDKVVTRESTKLLGLDGNLLKKNFHDFTADASGLFVDTINGGLRKDLTPLLLAGAANQSLVLPKPNGDWPRDFSSKSPIIPGRKHAMVGPSFDMLRSWAQMKNLSGLSTGTVSARVEPLRNTSNALRTKPAERWPYGRTDGATYRWDTWAQEAPRLHPVMTEARWHYYFSYTGSGTSTNIRTHIMPRVCLWNPYNVSMRVPTLVALMPNPYWQRGAPFEFYVEQPDINTIKNKPAYVAANANMVRWNGRIRINGAGTNNDPNQPQGLFPQARFLGFTLESAVIPPGECLVYSPNPTANTVTSGSVRIGKYDVNNISNNVLSASSEQGKNHFYLNLEKKQIELMGATANGSGSVVVNTQVAPWNSFLNDCVLSTRGITRYLSQANFYDGCPFALKAPIGSPSMNVRSDVIANSNNFASLQLINCSVGGSDTYDYWEYFMPDSLTGSGGAFGRLADFQLVGPKSPPRCHMWGAKLMWLDETAHEGVNYAIRHRHWQSNPQHTVFNQAPIANWNVRPNYIGRSPSSFISEEWDVTSLGSWMLEHNPSTPQAGDDMPTVSSNGLYATAALGKSAQFAGVGGGAAAMTLFDLPNPDFGVISIGALRHAQLSPFSWTPSYVVGTSLADMNAPTDQSAHDDMVIAKNSIPMAASYPTRWDILLGKSGGDGSPAQTYSSLRYGTRTWRITSEGCLQQGLQAPGNVSVEGQSVDVSDEIFAYDIAYEVNHNLWDSFYFSSLPLQGNAVRWTPSTGERLLNTRYGYNAVSPESMTAIEQKLNSATDGAAFAFWNSAAFVKNFGSFNVNSTSVDAWTAVLSGMRGLERQSVSGNVGGGDLTVFSRLFKPATSSTDNKGGAANSPDAWAAARVLSDADIRNLAEKIVVEVKNRGPFLSIADFINRRLETANNDNSRMGAIDTAIRNCEFNAKFNAAPYKAGRLTLNDTRKQSWRPQDPRMPDRIPDEKAWGATGFLTQGDILESVGSSLAARGDTFTIRAYGEAKDANGKVLARAMLEATVTRSPEFVDQASFLASAKGASGNRATDPVNSINRADASLDPRVLTSINQKFGRKFQMVSYRWLSSNEI